MHIIISMILSPLLVLLSAVLCGASAQGSVPTYERRDPLTGATLTCDKCPPGTHMAAHCTATTPTRCELCQTEHFTEFWNYLPRCLYCSNVCVDNQVVERECTVTANRVCRCVDGFYGADDFCIRHKECAPGSGVVTKGTSQTDTVCEQCTEGSFSNATSALEACVNHQVCPSGQIALLSGSIYHDTVCGTCRDLERGGETSTDFYSGLFSMHRMRVTKLRKFVTRYIYKSGEARRVRDTSVPRQRGLLMDEIRGWLAEASRDQLKRLPEMLRATQLTAMADKLDKRLEEIRQGGNCSSV
ncbi:tumor necrosis factor receptor superfamily member 6B-like [Sparus aurata]|uniref:Tumor necrosis factor receptor superfamily member 6B-like n=1 Tax=Sparus aurata TaxID=8175 RepID=A0A671XS89_SPAAU|nr:tumor necrosis factor receptor superfamily member 6B-like [Sparus aurata]